MTRPCAREHPENKKKEAWKLLVMMYPIDVSDPIQCHVRMFECMVFFYGRTVSDASLLFFFEQRVHHNVRDSVWVLTSPPRPPFCPGTATLTASFLSGQVRTYSFSETH